MISFTCRTMAANSSASGMPLVNFTSLHRSGSVPIVSETVRPENPAFHLPEMREP
jgi:hypothetical protein